MADDECPSCEHVRIAIARSGDGIDPKVLFKTMAEDGIGPDELSRDLAHLQAEGTVRLVPWGSLEYAKHGPRWMLTHHGHAEDFERRDRARVESRLALIPTYRERPGEPPHINHAAVCTAYGCDFVYGVESDKDLAECRRAADNHNAASNHDKVVVSPWRKEGMTLEELQRSKGFERWADIDKALNEE